MEDQFQFTNRLKTTFGAIAIIGLILGLIGVFAFDVSGYHAWGTYLSANFYFLLAGLSGVTWMAIQYVSNAGWSVGFRRIFEAMGSYTFIGFISMLVIILFGIDAIYHHWADPALLDPDSEKYDPIVEGKSPYLNVPFFTFRFFFFFAAILGCIYFFRKWSHEEDKTGEGLKYFKKTKRLSIIFIIAFAFLFTMGTFDWLMSIDSHWYSTIYSVYVFAGMMGMGVAITTLLTIWLQKLGHLSFITKEHYHDLGKFMFGFSIFWMYIWFAQYMLIWYANLPETNIYFVYRLQDGWEILFFGNIIINFLIPFLVLMTRDAKRNLSVLATVAVIMLIGRFIDIYQMVMPGVTEAPLSFGLAEIGFFTFFAGLFLLVTCYSLSRINLVPSYHPHLEEAKHHEVNP